MREQARSVKEWLIEQILDLAVSDGKGAREARRAKLREKTTDELRKILQEENGAGHA